MARRSLAPGFRRRWSPVSDALSDGRLDMPLLCCVLLVTPPAAPMGSRPRWALYAST